MSKSSKQSAHSISSAGSSKEGVRLNAANEPMKPAAITKLDLRTVKATDSGATVNMDAAEYSHVKVDFVKFYLEEMVRQNGFNEKVFPHLTLPKDSSRVQKLQLKIGGAEYDVLCGGAGGSMLTCTVAKVELPAQGLITMEYVSPYGELKYVDEHAIEINFGEPKADGGCCVIA
jgi:hypothetical protein